MKQRLCSYGRAYLLLIVGLSYPVMGQQPAESVYRVKVITKTRKHIRGILSDISESTIYIDYDKRLARAQVPLADIRKVVLRRNSKKNALITGAIIGGLITGFAANQSLQTNQVRTPVIYGLNLTFAAAGGAAAGLLVGSGIGNLTKIVIRPLTFTNPDRSLFRQLEPFTSRYQQDMINRVPKTSEEQL